MTEVTHPELVSALVKPAGRIYDEMTSHKIALTHMALGLAGECGEVVDEIKKFTMNNKALNIDKIISEIGDLEFYLEGLRQELQITRETCLAGNITKLSTRFPGLLYSDTKAQEKADQK